MLTFTTIVHVFVSILLICAILLQSGRGGGLAGQKCDRVAPKPDAFSAAIQPHGIPIVLIVETENRCCASVQVFAARQPINTHASTVGKPSSRVQYTHHCLSSLSPPPISLRRWRPTEGRRSPPRSSTSPTLASWCSRGRAPTRRCSGCAAPTSRARASKVAVARGGKEHGREGNGAAQSSGRAGGGA